MIQERRHVHGGPLGATALSVVSGEMKGELERVGRWGRVKPHFETIELMNLYQEIFPKV